MARHADSLPQAEPRGLLLVDDDRDFADSLAGLLRLEGYRVHVAYTFATAVASADAFRHPVALIDIRLGLVSGVELVRALQQRNPDCIAVMITAYSSVEATIAALQAGAYDYLCKPFHTGDLLATLERCFERVRLESDRRHALATLEARNRELETANADLARFQEELARSEARLRQMLENSPSAIALDDLRGNRLLANARMGDWFPGGLPAELGAADRSLVVSSELEVATGGRARRLLVTRFPVVDGEGSVTGVGTIATDMTEQHHAAERLRQSQRLEALGQLTGGIAHDFNNLLSVILGNLRLIEEDIGGAPALLELLEEALDATRSGVELTARLLAFGRGQPLHPEVGDMRELVLVISRLIGRTLGESVPVRLFLPSEPCLVRIDRARLEAALLNLAINARDAMAGSGELVITVRPGPRTGRVPAVAGSEAGEFIAVTVADGGCGMTDEICERAVQPFFTTKREGHGSGLGLSMVHGFVQQSGGGMWISSAPGRGTTVEMSFPALPSCDAPAPPRGSRASLAPAGKGERVLLVEDQPRVRLLLERQLARLGYQVIAAADGRAALALLDAGHGIDLLLSDLVLPGEMNGVELCDAVRARAPQVAVLLTTGYAADALVDRLGATMVAAVLRKPVEPGTLARAMRAALDGRPDAQPAAGATNM